ncbi:DUF3237 domain-containing protein [Aquibium sp. LZ166]|uniref:UPF0311 protein ABGN05_17475 n=1 Tax=Aquibium pacificus TaxID=3153579 RepID=A0ABV3SMI2_9HYPH
MVEVQLKPLFEMRAHTANGATDIGEVPVGYKRRVVFVTGGTFSGDRLKGKVLPGGGDFLMMRPDGGMHLDVRLVLETDEGERIYMTYVGRRHGPPEVMERYRNSEPVAYGEDYFRTIIQFETAAPRLTWLNGILGIGAGYRTAEGAVYEVFEIL